MATDKTSIQHGGMHGILATELAAQIDGGTKSAAHLMALGVPFQLAVEIVAQANGKAGNAAKLMALGVPAALAITLKADLDAAV